MCDQLGSILVPQISVVCARWDGQKRDTVIWEQDDSGNITTNNILVDTKYARITN